ncbi:hypothetical protein T11_4862 [Trichinella zimbabwensis]|uniref:Uncharacterized protein n=1 Tax=Trichinella zimbabwensis TaxID=268475 RepID=A0A0V1H4M4_9BILA|nr:hypothetical protein T11_4862 [Trichinella zimbabwensis]
MPKVQSATEWNILPGVTISYFTCWANKMRVVGRKLTKLWKAEAEAFYPECFVQSCGVQFNQVLKNYLRALHAHAFANALSKRDVEALMREKK